jgi:hypothetical protein
MPEPTAVLAPPIRSPYLTPKEAASYAKVSAQLLAIMRMKGTGPKYRMFNTQIRYRPEDLDAYMELNHAHKVAAPNVGRPPGKKNRPRRKAARS